MAYRRIILDNEHDGKPGDEFRLIDSDLALLRYAISVESLHIVGPRLCRWARTFFEGRGEPLEHAQSVSSQLVEMFPALGATEARDLAKRLAERGVTYSTSATVLQPHTLMELLYPGFAWNAQPSVQHAAAYLLWILRSHPDATWGTLVSPLASTWENNTGTSIRVAYSARTPDEARTRVFEWLGLATVKARFPIFPLDIPDDETGLSRELRALSMRTGGRAHERLGSGAPSSVYVLAAEVDYRYLQQNPDDVTPEVISALASALSGDKLRRLQTMVPRPVPTPAPSDMSGMVHWFKEEYLPFRTYRWLSGNADGVRDNTLSEVVEDFVPKALEHYADALFGGAAEDHLNHVRMAKLVRAAEERRERVVLVALFDGLTVPDGELVQRVLERVSTRLQTLSSDIAIATLPTITRYAKLALLTGKPPSLSDHANAIARLTKFSDVRSTLQDARPGDVIVWSIMEPDKSYHGASDAASAVAVAHSQLEAVARQIADLADEPQASVPVEVVICTDHGRLMDVSRRSISPPQGWGAHGRAAWGNYSEKIPASGFVRDGELVYLDSQHFRLPEDVAFIWGSASYLTDDGRTGIEVSPHGGAYPEEILVPWIVLSRDQGQAEVDVVVIGEGRVQQPGELTIRLENRGASPATVLGVELEIPGRDTVSIPLGVALAASSRSEVRRQLDAWPSSQEASHAEGQVRVGLPNGRRLMLDCRVQITSADMYTRDDLLDELS